jgi:hypothetical protein
MDQKPKLDQYLGGFAESVKGSVVVEIEERLCITWAWAGALFCLGVKRFTVINRAISDSSSTG